MTSAIKIFRLLLRGELLLQPIQAEEKYKA